MNARSACSGVLTLGIAVWLGFGLAGCSKDDTSTTTGTATGRVRMFVTDAPLAIDAVNLVIREVAVRRDDADTSSGWERLRTDSTSINLLDFTNGALGPLADATIPAGHYTQVRLILGSGSTVVVDGVIHPLEVPSGTTSGLKINGDFTVPGGGAVDLALDFDASRAIIQTGSGTWKLKPVVRLVTTVATTGRIIGTIAPADTPAVVVAVMGGDTLQSATTVAGGGFTLALLPAGTYSVTIRPAALSRDTTFSDVLVTAGQTTDLHTIALVPLVARPQ